MVPEQNYEETDRLEMLLLRQDVLSDFLLDTWKADFKTSSKWRAIPNVDPHSLPEKNAVFPRGLLNICVDTHAP